MRRNPRVLPALAGLAVLVMAGAVFPEEDKGATENWPGFRGPKSLPVSENPNLPDRWSKTENVEWVAEVPGVGWSSPVVWGRNVFLTAAESDQPMKPPSLGTDFSNDYIAELRAQGLSSDEVNRKLYARDREMPHEIVITLKLYCHDLETGKLLWEREVYRGNPRGGRHRKNSFASETPVTDGENVYVYFTQHGLYAFDMSGKEVWTTPLEAHPTIRDYGTGASPALHGDRLFVLNDNEEESFLAAFDKRTGKALWRTPRSFGTPRKTGWSTPFVWENP
ncbi:MAG TPA: PQQ-binding-like beta-propeller repeat protein, partial [Vicinamibacteria bacterium]